MSESEEDSTSISKQKSIFSGMTRVKQIHHLREKWSPKSKSPLPDRAFVDTPPSSPWNRRASPAKYALGQTPGPYRDTGRPTTRRTQSMNGSPRGQPMITIVDMERYLAINTWLENNDINVAPINASGDESRTKSKNRGLFDDMYSSLDVLENNLKSELSHLGINEKTEVEIRNKEKCHEERRDASEPPPALFDYLAVIGADMLDVKIRNFWSQKENVYESTIVFAHPPESQFNAESLEHFCFPAGVKTSTPTTIGCDRSSDFPDESTLSKEGDFFVLMISGGGVHGQSVQYAMCMKGTITIRGADGKNLLLPMCYCIIAQIPLIPFFRALLQGFLDNLRNEFESSASSECSPLSSIVTDKHAGYVDDILQTLKKISLPDKGLSVSVEVFPSPSPELILARPHKENDMDEKVVLLLQWALPSLLSRLSIDRLLQILSLLLIEVKLIVVSDEIPLLSSATLGLASLLHPLTWTGPVISVLPPSMHEYMEAPVPLICGVDELPREFECSKGTCILHLAENRVQLHVDDERSFGKLQMPELEILSCDLTRFMKQMLGRVTGSFRDNVTPLSTHLVIHRVRRHIEHLITICSHTREQYRDQEANDQLDAREIRFVDVFMQTQMYQKYQDDRPITMSTDQSNQQQPSTDSVKDELPTKGFSTNTQHHELKSAASILFQIALAGVSALPRSTPVMDNMPTTIVDNVIEVPSHGTVKSSTPDEPESGSVKLSSAASSPSARLFSNMRKSPHEKAESPPRGYELLSPTVSEVSAHSERRPDQTFVWPLSQSELDVFWVTDEASPGSLVLHSPRSETFESPHRSTNNESEARYVDVPKTISRSELGSLVNAQRTDTEMTISIFDTTLTEALGSANAVDDAWLFEPPNDPKPRPQHNDDSDEDRSTIHESSAEDDDTPVHNESFIEEAGNEQNISSPNARRPWLDEHNDGIAVNLKSYDGVLLTLVQVKTLTTGINVESRGAWEGWCEGKMFVSPDFTTLIWERHAAAFTALNMKIRDITSVGLEDREIVSPSGPVRRQIQLNFSDEAIYFQFTRSFQHDSFFEALKQLIRSVQENEDRHRSFKSLSSPPQLQSHIVNNEHRRETTNSCDDTKPTDVIQVHSFIAQMDTDIHLFKQKLQRGFLVEKHGRLGKPHAKLLFTDAMCSHIMWRKPSTADTNDQNIFDHQLQGRPRFFSHDKSIPVDSITAIVTGKQTAVFRRAVANKSNDRVCLSILTPTRTLDICAYSLEGFQELYRGFSLLLEEIKRTRDGLD